MNINSALPGITPYQPVASANTAPANNRHEMKLGMNIIPSFQKAADYQHDKVMTKEEKADFAKSFYKYQEVSWPEVKKGTTYCTEFSYTTSSDKDGVMEILKSESGFSLFFIGFAHDQFRKNLQYTNPELAKKHYGFTLGDDGSLKILDPSKNLTPAEKDWLTESLNKVENLRSHVHMHAKVIMTLVDHDTETFGGRFILNLDNFHKAIDYLEIIGNSSENRAGPVMYNRLIQGIAERADLRNSRFEATA